jgi:hypothetical protein
LSVPDDRRVRYRPDIVEALLRHGVRPSPETRPELVHEFVGDLYRHELRRLRDCLKRGEFPRREYFDRVVAIRERYRILALRPGEWLEEQSV